MLGVLKLVVLFLHLLVLSFELVVLLFELEAPGADGSLMTCLFAMIAGSIVPLLFALVCAAAASCSLCDTRQFLIGNVALGSKTIPKRTEAYPSSATRDFHYVRPRERHLSRNASHA